MFNGVDEKMALEFLACARRQFKNRSFDGVGFMLGSFPLIKQVPGEPDLVILSWLCLHGYLITAGNQNQASLPDRYQVSSKGFQLIVPRDVAVAV